MFMLFVFCCVDMSFLSVCLLPCYLYLPDYLLIYPGNFRTQVIRKFRTNNRACKSSATQRGTAPANTATASPASRHHASAPTF